MASTNKTANYNLNQWVSTDFFKMSDFNADNLAIDTALAGKADIAFGTYVGNGGAGSSHPVSMSFSFDPAAVLVIGHGGIGSEAHEVCAVFIRNHTAGAYTVASGGAAKCVELPCSWNGHSFSFHSASGTALEQLNAQGENYGYVAIGV